MDMLKLDIRKSGVEITPAMQAEAQQANALLHSGKGAGNDFLGWVHLPSSISDADLAALQAQADNCARKPIWSSASVSAAPIWGQRRSSRR